jgi:hypothetical protein
MLTAVHLEDEARFFAQEIRDVRSYRYLAPKLPAFESSRSKVIPEQFLGIGHCRTKLLGIFSDAGLTKGREMGLAGHYGITR